MFVTFYSYKGGVGRSMALANTACLLAEDPEHPQRVLLWDFDLEAPGLHKLFPPTDSFGPGFVDMAYEFAETQVMPNPKDFIYTSKVKGIDILPAGRVDQSYCGKLEQLDWTGFFGDDPSDKGAFFGKLTSWMIDGTDEFEKRYDYILIDSRTGLNDVAGICTQVLPDLVMFIFRLTDQNLDGIEHLVPTIRTQLNDRNKVNVRLLPIASVVLSQSSENLDKRRKRASAVFGLSDLDYIRFDPDLIAEERLFCRREVQDTMWPKAPIVDDYERLSEAIRSENPKDTQTALQELEDLMGTGDFVSARKLLVPLLKRRSESPKVWSHLRMLFFSSPARDSARFADDLVKDILHKSESNIYALEWKASECAGKAKSASDPELLNAKEFLEAALRFGSERDQFRLHRKLSEIASAVGNLELATKELKECHSIAKSNVEVLLDLAKLYLRRGRDYFAMAAELFENEEIQVLDQVLIYLWTFLGNEEKADNYFRNWIEQEPDVNSSQSVQLVTAYRFLFRGEPEEAKLVAERSLKSEPDESALANWGEFFLCAEDFRRAIEIFELTHVQTSDSEYKGHILLSKYLAGIDKTSLESVLQAWDNSLWSFTELLFFRERAKANDSCVYRNRLGVIEKLIQESELIPPTNWSWSSVFWRRLRRAI